MADPLPQSFTTSTEVPIALVDYYMPVGAGGFQFVAALMAYIRSYGPSFPVEYTRAANLRAASTLCHMAIVRGETFLFIRDAIQMTQAEAAAFLGVTVPDIVSWESNTVPIPRSIWDAMAHRCCDLDMRGFTPELGFNCDFRARVIRIRVDPPYPPKSFVPPGLCPPIPCR